MMSPLSARPKSFKKLWTTSPGCTAEESQFSVWEPVPPEGFVSVGNVAIQGDEPPPMNSVFCLAKPVTTCASIRDCVFRPSSPNSRNRGSEKGQPFWRISNKMSSFSARASFLEVTSFAVDIREFKAVQEASTSAGGEAQNEAQEIPSRIIEGAQLSWPEIGHAFVRCSSYKPLWSWHNSKEKTESISVWRPEVPAGCFSLGDVAVERSRLPDSCFVVRDLEDGLLAKPLSWRKLAHLRIGDGNRGVSFWFPVAPQGYTALGTVASVGQKEPELEIVRCVRSDACIAVDSEEVCTLSDGASTRQPTLSFWRIKSGVNTFLVREKVGKPPDWLALGLFGLDAGPATSQLNVRLPDVSMTIQDDFGSLMTPILEFAIAKPFLKAVSADAMWRAQAGLDFRASTFSPVFGIWEPLLEHWPTMVAYSSLSAGTSISQFKMLSDSLLNVNISTRGLNHLLEAYASWMRLAAAEETVQRHYFAKAHKEEEADADDEADASMQQSQSLLTKNRTGMDIFVRSPDAEGGLQTLCIPPGGSESVALLPSAGSSRSSSKGFQHNRTQWLVSICIDRAVVNSMGLEGRLWACLVEMEGTTLSSMSAKCLQAARTAGRPFSLNHEEPSKCLVSWNEHFVFELFPGVTLQPAEEPKGPILMSGHLGRHVLDQECNVVTLTFIDSESGSAQATCKLAVSSLLPKQWHNVRSRIRQVSSAEPLWLPVVATTGEQQIGTVCLRGTLMKLGSQTQLSDLDKPQEAGPCISFSNSGPWIDIGCGYSDRAVPLQFPQATIARELTVSGGIKSVALRSLVVVSNESSVGVDVSLVPSGLVASGQERGVGGDGPEGSLSRSSSSACTPDVGVTEAEELFENQRIIPFLGWSSKYLLPTDPGVWSDRNIQHSDKEFHEPLLPPGWVWTTDWHVEVNETVDAEGWAYYPVFSDSTWPPPGPDKRVKGVIDVVRRRRWVRFRQYFPEAVIDRRVVLGTLQPGESLPLPVPLLNQNFDDLLIQVRPALDQSLPGRSQSYSWGTSATQESNRISRGLSEPRWRRGSYFCARELTEMEDLICCSPLTTDGGEAGQPMWFMVSAESTEMRAYRASNLHEQNVKDWKVKVLQPLQFKNELPVPLSLSIWIQRSHRGQQADQAWVLAGEASLDPDRCCSVHSVCPSEEFALSLLLSGEWEVEAGSEKLVISQSTLRDGHTCILMTNRVSGRKLEITVQASFAARSHALRAVTFSVAGYFDASGCPPVQLLCSFNGEAGAGCLSSCLQCVNWQRRNTSEGGVRSIVIDKEAPENGPWIFSRFDTTMSISVALKGGPFEEQVSVISLMEGQVVKTKACAADGSYLQVVVYNDARAGGPSAKEVANRRVIKFRPLLTFTNRTGEVVFLRARNDHGAGTELATGEWKAPYLHGPGSDADNFQIKTAWSEWSNAFQLLSEERFFVPLRALGDNSRHTYLIEVGSGGDGSRFTASVRFGGQTLPFKLENMSRAVVSFRQAGLTDVSWEALQPTSSVLYAWEDPQGARQLELLAEGCSTELAGLYDILRPGCHPRLRVAAGSSFERELEVTVIATDTAPVVKLKEVLFSSDDEVPEAVEPHGTLNNPQDGMSEVKVEVAAVGISGIDGKPQELFYIFSEDVSASYTTWKDKTRMRLALGEIQVDNQLPLTPNPILLVPEKAAADACLKLILEFSNQPQPGEEVYPFVGLQVAETSWLLHVHEAFVWRLLDFISSLRFDRASDSAASQQPVQVDPMVKIDELEASAIKLKLTLDADPSSRPSGVLGPWSALVTAAANTHNMRINIKGTSGGGRRIRKSAIVEAAAYRLLRDLAGQVFRILSGVDVLGVLSSTLSSLSRGTASLAILRSTGESLPHFQAPINQPEGVGEGLLYGAEAVAQGVARGVTGVIARSQSGFQRHGPPGLVLGILKGTAGLFLHPVSGCLSSCAFIVDGISAGMSSGVKALQSRHHVERVRLPRAIKGDLVIRDYNTRDAVGQFLLHEAEAGTYFGKRDIFRSHGKFSVSDLYVSHCVVAPRKRLVITNKRVLLLKCPGGNPEDVEAADPALLHGGPCFIRWDVPWVNVLDVEVTTLSGHDVVVIVHLRFSSRKLFRVIPCIKGRKPEDVLLDISGALQEYGQSDEQKKQTNVSFLSSRRRRYAVRSKTDSQSGSFKRSARLEPLLTLGSRTLTLGNAASGELCSWQSSREPSSMGSLPRQQQTQTFVRVWAAKSASRAIRQRLGLGRGISIWRPIPPEGYVTIGDVLSEGSERPGPVSVYLDLGVQSFTKPVDYKLVWRSEDKKHVHPGSIWLPIAPEGFVAMGCVAVSGFKKPLPEERPDLRCPSEGLLHEASVTTEPSWRAEASPRFPWPCKLLRVENNAETFYATRSSKVEACTEADGSGYFRAGDSTVRGWNVAEGR